MRGVVADLERDGGPPPLRHDNVGGYLTTYLPLCRSVS
jgi:hypothetical protein